MTLPKRYHDDIFVTELLGRPLKPRSAHGRTYC
jgi:hypothetical protein